MTTRALLVAVSLAVAAGGASIAVADEGARPRRIAITVTGEGFEPEGIRVRKDEKVTLVFTRKVRKTCAKEVVIQIDDDHRVERKLPLDKPVAVTVRFPRAGKIRYACAMDMHGGVVTVQ